MAVPLNLLILEDRPTDAELLIFELRDAGYQPIWKRVDTEADYLAALNNQLDIILADFSLPQFNALRALRHLQDRQLDIPFIVVTGTISEEVAVDCMKQGAADYLIKDRLGRLGQAVERALEQKRLHDEKSKADLALRDSEVRFRSLVQNLGDIITVHNLDSLIVYESPSASRILGYPPGDLIGKTLLDLIHQDDRKKIQNWLRLFLKREITDAAIEFRFLHASGKWVHLESTASHLNDPHGEDGIVITTRDITERKQAEEDLQRAHQELADAYNATIAGWSRALELRDHDTEGHTQRVTEMTVILARELKCSAEEIIHISRGSLLHDIGKMGVPDQILLKPGPLTEDEWLVMRRHPIYAYNMLHHIPYLSSALNISYCHHERWDGTGYPNGLKGEEIPLPARIFAVIDVWDALSSDRPYRDALPYDEVFKYVKDNAGTQFDPEIAKVFLALMEKGAFNQAQ
jgi:PAS domain S-box-containing protein